MEKKELTSPRLKSLEKDFEKVKKAKVYLEGERAKLIKEKEKIKKKITKEKEVLRLKKRISYLRNR